jgi:hypothetical protein
LVPIDLPPPSTAYKDSNLCALTALHQGLDAAGKTTVLYKLKLGEFVQTIPTIGTAPIRILSLNEVKKED